MPRKWIHMLMLLLMLVTQIGSAAVPVAKSAQTDPKHDVRDASVQPSTRSVASEAAELDRKSTRLNSSHVLPSRMPSSA